MENGNLPSCSRVSVFDLDHTLLLGNSSFYFGLYLIRNRVITLARASRLLLYYGLHKANLFSLAALHRTVFRICFQGGAFADYAKLVAQFLQDDFQRFLYPPAIERLRMAQARGDLVAILSSSPEFLVTAIGERLSVSVAKGSVYACDEHGVFSHVSLLMDGAEKAAWVNRQVQRLKIERLNTWAYTDSMLDLPLLRVVGNPIVVNPDKQLSRLAKRNQWEIL